ncbi:MAG: hypothetical protein KC483_05685 [Nitrosarchaeum sp.]|nr:hypothetical protein [Nitrosarchaeum sp.]MCA9819526.1 hypothetical protein [Nitrosarchaeum sp.]
MTSYADVDSPKKQMKEGTMAEEVVCRAGYELVIRTSGVPNCVKPSTEEKMKERGLGFTPIPITESNKEIQTVPASVSSILNFYITDPDLNIANKGIEIVPVRGLLEFTINGIAIEGPETMIETGPDTGQFYVKLQIPDTINGKPISQDDIVLIKYIDKSDSLGEQRTLVKSVLLSNTFAKVQSSGGGSRIGHEFTLRLYEPDANRDSRDEDKIPLSLLEYRGNGGIKTTLANPRFDANSASLIETGPNTSTFEVKIKIPREIDGKTIHIGDWYEITYIDRSTPSQTNEKIILKGRVG